MATVNYTVLDKTRYTQTVKQARQKVPVLLAALSPYRQQDLNAQVQLLVNQLQNIPYLDIGAMGEGDWQAAASTYQPGAVHIEQDPVYRLDGLDCQTFVQVVMALLQATTLDTFDQAYLNIAYGAAGNPRGERVHYFNRNHFVDGDWNPSNEQQGFLTDVMVQAPLSTYALTETFNLSRQGFFTQQAADLSATVRVLNKADGHAMIQRYQTLYTHLPFAHFDNQEITITYLPKTALASLGADGQYHAQPLLNDIPTPAVIEIVRDPTKWRKDGHYVKDTVGTPLSISHMGLLYKQTFKRGAVIYQRIDCLAYSGQPAVCTVKPVTCQQATCHKLMFAHATDAYPDRYYWYKRADGRYACTPYLPASANETTYCNRVEAMPFFDYLTRHTGKEYWYMDNPSILGIHVEAL